MPIGDIGDKDSQRQAIVAVDCEMCYTSKALELIRITLVGGDEQVYKGHQNCASAILSCAAQRKISFVL